MTKFYDTCACLNLQEKAFIENFCISSITLKELENIKTSFSKDEETKELARHFSKLLDMNEGVCKIYQYHISYDEELKKYDLPCENDNKIVITAIINCPECIFVSDDINCKNTAKAFNIFPYVLSTNDIISKENNYTGYKEILLDTEEKMLNFYSNLDSFKDNDVYENEYLLLLNKDKTIADKYKYTSCGLKEIQYPCFESTFFGKVRPKDEYQFCLMDSFKNHIITLAGGPAGSGKTFLALAYLFQELERGKIDRIVIFCNPVVARNACKLGFYPGTKDEKLLASQVGNVLTSKLGKDIVDDLIFKEKLILIPVGDSRGYEVPPHSGVYILEAQNLTIDLMKLILQRIGEDCKVIVDGDRLTQLDMQVYAGANNGMVALSKAFRNENCFGQVDLKNIYRSKIANIADKM